MQKLVVQICVHLSLLVDRIRHLTSVPAAEECFSPTSLTCPADILSRSRERGTSFEAEREKSRFTRRLLQFVLADRKVLYSEASMCPCILSAAAQSWASKSRFEPLDGF